MTKYRVTNDFVDKNTGDLIKAGDVFEADGKRVEELSKADVIGDAVTDKQVKQEQQGNDALADVLKQTAEEVINQVNDIFTKEELEKLLQLESNGKDRKTVKEHIESLLKDDADADQTDNTAD